MSGAMGKARRRTLTWLAGAAAIALGLAAWAMTPPPAPKVRKEVGSLVAPGFAGRAGEVSSIAVTTAEETYHIVRTADGWVEPETRSSTASAWAIRSRAEPARWSRSATARARPSSGCWSAIATGAAMCASPTISRPGR
jgi:hypothetical protein